MFIDISKIPQGTSNIKQVLTLPEELAHAGGVTPEVDADIAVRRLESTLYVSISFTGSVERECDRCLKSFTEGVVGSVDFILQQAEDSEEYEGEVDCYRYRDEQDEVDFSQTLYDAMLLKLGYRALCKTDCEGLGGAEPVEDEMASTEDESVDPRWAALAKMKKNNK